MEVLQRPRALTPARRGREGPRGPTTTISRVKAPHSHAPLESSAEVARGILADKERLCHHDALAHASRDADPTAEHTTVQPWLEHAWLEHSSQDSCSPR